jgi:hypothetical protein
MKAEPLWIGLDVGGSGARALTAERAEGRWAAQAPPLEFVWDDDFRPVPLREQLAYPGELTALEEVCGSQRVRLLAEWVSSVASGRSFRLGVCAPGLKTSDGLGIQAWRNGPRRLTFLRDLERSIRGAGGEVVGPLAPLCPDSLACALGESRGGEGALREISNGLCVSGGSGVGEALLVDGSCFALDELEPPLPRAWELAGGDGGSLEDRVAPGRVMSSWLDSGETGAPEECDGEAALRLLEAQDAGLLILIERSRAWFSARGLELDRVALCQTLGRLYAKAPERLEALRSHCGSTELITSEFRGAPALGAVIAAAGLES